MMCDLCALECNLAESELKWCDTDDQGRTEPGENSYRQYVWSMGWTCTIP